MTSTATANTTSMTSSSPTADPLDGRPYPSLYSWTHIVVSSSLVTVIMLVIVAGNVLVIAAVATSGAGGALSACGGGGGAGGTQNWFIASLGAADILVGLFIMPLSLANELMGYWAFGKVLCELWLATDVLLCTASILNLVLISLDRYWSVTRPLTYARRRGSRRRAAGAIAAVWAAAALVCFPPLVGWKRPQPARFERYPLCLLSEEPGYVIYSTVASFYLVGKKTTAEFQRISFETD